MLCWNEYYNGRWQPTKTSDVNRPAWLGRFAPKGFDRSNLRLSVKEEEGRLRVAVEGENAALFVLYNSHSLPVVYNGGPVLSYVPERSRRINTSSDALKIYYNQGDGHFDGTGYTPSTELERDLLKNNLDDRGVTPQHKLQNPWDAPFFYYEDSRHVFYVETEQAPVWISTYPKYGVVAAPAFRPRVEIPPIVLQPDEPLKRKPRFWGDGGPVDPDPGIIDPAPLRRFVTEDAHIHRAIGTTGRVMYGNKQIGPAGAIATDRVTN